MPNIASLLKTEISRVARKEVRAETSGLKKAVSVYRAEIAALKRRAQALELELLRLSKAHAKAAPVAVQAQPSDCSKPCVVRSLPTQQSDAIGLDLVDQRQVLVPPTDCDLVHPDGAQRSELAMLEPPLHDIFHRVADLVQVVPKLVAVSFHDSLRAQCARYNM